jgi:hypothetical protein
VQVRSLGFATLVFGLVAVAAATGCGGEVTGADSIQTSTPQETSPTEESSAAEFCAARQTMLDAQQQWTIDYLVGLTVEETVANRQEQAAVADPVRRMLPPEFEDEWDELEEVGALVDQSIDDLRPPGQTLEPVLAQVTADGFGSITEFVFRDGLDVAGHKWTYREYRASGDQLADALDEYCS